MCLSRNSKKVKIGNRIVRVDKCLANLIKILNEKGIRTLGSCCGHFRYPTTLIVNFDGNIIELMSGIKIERTRNFYRKDKKDFYFIPELKDIVKKKCKDCGSTNYPYHEEFCTMGDLGWK